MTTDPDVEAAATNRPDLNNPLSGCDLRSLDAIVKGHVGSWGCLHTGLCEVCALIRRCERLIASYEAKVEDLAKETQRCAALSAARDAIAKRLGLDPNDVANWPAIRTEYSRD